MNRMIPMTTPLRCILAATFMLASIALFSACSSGDSDDPGIGDEITQVIPTAVPSQAPASPTPAGTPTPIVIAGNPNLRGFIYPIANGCLPKGDQLMPNAPREYRNGTHEGVDFYGVDNCTAITRGSPVTAAKGGTVIRADLDYVNPTAAQMQGYLADPNTDASFDAFRGRQVWIQLDDGGVYVNRYCHLDGIAPGITRGTRVTAGQLIAFVGETGTPESISNPGTEYHLHFEMRIGSSYLGAGLPAAQVRQLYQTLLAP